MATCAVCGGQDFNENDGEYFCSVCETQNHELRVVEAEEQLASNFTFTTAVPSGPRERRVKKRTVESQPWTSDEAFLIILALQAEALKQVGAPDIIKDVIFKLWSTFLSRTGSGFTDTEESESPVVLPVRERDRLVGNKDMPRIRNNTRRRGYFKHEIEGKEEEVEELIEMDQDDVDDEIVSGSTEISLQTLRKRPLYMKLATTLSICQIALLYTTDLVTSADIIKWTKEGTLPYQNVIDLLPEFMELSAKDLCTFVPLKMISSRELRHLTGKLMYKLGLTPLPSVDIEKLISRHVAELELPVSLNGMACRLYRHANVKILRELQERGRALPCHSAIAMGYIVVVMCLVFGCDDVTEKRLDKSAKENERSQPFFIFAEWKHHMDQKRLKNVDNQKLPSSYQDIKTCNLKLRADIANTQVARYIRQPKKIDRMDNRVTLQNPLRTLLIRSESRLESRQGVAMERLYYDTPMKQPRETESPVPRGKDFRHCQIFHLENDRSVRDSSEDDELRPHEQYCLHWCTSLNTKSDTYNWLLRTCSEFAHCDVADIQELKERLELVFVLAYSTPALAKMSSTTRKRFVRSRFFN